MKSLFISFEEEILPTPTGSHCCLFIILMDLVLNANIPLKVNISDSADSDIKADIVYTQKVEREIQGEILASLMSTGVLSLTSVRPGLHPHTLQSANAGERQRACMKRMGQVYWKGNTKMTTASAIE